jgi:hypothetical protein
MWNKIIKILRLLVLVLILFWICNFKIFNTEINWEGIIVFILYIVDSFLKNKLEIFIKKKKFNSFIKDINYLTFEKVDIYLKKYYEFKDELQYCCEEDFKKIQVIINQIERQLKNYKDDESLGLMEKQKGFFEFTKDEFEKLKNFKMK